MFMLNKTKLWLSVFPLVIINNFISIPAQATSNDAITLESIRAVSTTVLTGENIVMELEVAVPAGYSWDPVNGTDGRQLPLTALICPNANWNGTRCSGSSQSLVANLETNSNLTSNNNRKTFQIKKIATLGEYKLYKVVIPQPSIYEDVHTYNKNASFALDSWADPTTITVPTFLNGDVSVVASLPTPTPTPTPTVSATPTPSASSSETSTPTPTPSVTETSTPTESNAGSSVAAQVINSILQPIGIQASGQSIKKTPNRNGDLTWQKSREVLTTNDEWSVRKNKKASGGSFVSTSVNGSKMQITTRGDAFTLRFMTGKKMGKIQVNVDGKKLAVINTNSISTKSKAKSWIGIGTGKHKIEIIPILDPGQSIGIDAYQVARAV
jgi:hypothetical protein